MASRSTYDAGSSDSQHEAGGPPAARELRGFDWDSAPMTLTTAQTRQFVTFYRALRGVDDRSIQERINRPRLCSAGSADAINYGPGWVGVLIDIAKPLTHRRAALESAGWEVYVLAGLDHTTAMQAVQVLPILRPWLVCGPAG